jgi:2,4-dienoyl-CoA reductase (NADPH2)
MAPGSALLLLVITHLPPVPVAVAVSVFGALMVCNVGRMIAATAMVISSVEPQRRGAFLSANASVQHVSSGFGSYLGGVIVTQNPAGKIQHFGAVGWIAALATLASLWLASRVHVVAPASAEELSMGAAAEAAVDAGKEKTIGDESMALDTASTQHGCPNRADHDREVPEVDLLSPLTIRGVTMRNRIAVSPMCQYCATNGLADDWHLVHLGSRAVGGAGLVMAEASAVTAQGRITPGDLGIWSDEHARALMRVAAFIKRMGAVPGIQLAHAGRKGSCRIPQEGGVQLSIDEGGWETIGPSAVAFHEQDRPPRVLNEAGIQDAIAAFAAAARRAVEAGFEVLEIHSAHGYLLHEFLSPLSNRRTDEYGGSLANRMRLTTEVATAIRAAVPPAMPLFVRISATDWVDGGWDVAQSIELARVLKTKGVDLIDVSSGALVPQATVPVARNYQVPFAAAIRNDAHIMTGAVGLITEPNQADEIVTGGAADIVLLAREMLREPYWAIKAQQVLNQEQNWPKQYGYAVKRRAK